MAASRTRDDRGASAVEFALVLPFLAMLMFGMIWTALAWSDHLSVTNAVREGARFGAGVDYSAVSPNWASSVRDRVKQTYNNSTSDLTDDKICVKVVDSTGATISGLGTSVTGANCGPAPDAPTMTTGNCAVLVWVQKPETIPLIVAPDLKLFANAQSVAYYGRKVGATCTASVG